MSINSIAAQYQTWTNSNGDTIGNAGGVDISYEDGTLLFTEADGDTYEVSAASLTNAQIQELAETLGATVTTTDDATSSDDSDLDANKEKQAELQAQWDTLNATAETIKATVEKLSDEIEDSLKAALEEQEEITQDEQQRIQELVSTQIDQFKKDKENGKDVTMTDLQSSISEGMKAGSFDDDMASIVSDLVVTNTKMVTMDGLLTELGVINGEMKMLDTEMTELENTIAEQEAAAAEAASCCDPIGFTDEEGVTYEFVVDKDNNGELSNFSEFLGSENFFDEMADLDADESGNVDNEELTNAGVKVLVTDADGNQTLKSIEEAFGGEDVSVNLGSYKEAADGATAANGQTLLGNFDISIGDNTYEGYSTLDSEEYLTGNYTFTDEDPNNLTTAASAAASDTEAAEASERAQTTEDIDAFIEEYQAKLEEFEQQFEDITELLGLDEELVGTIKELAEEEGQATAQSIIKEAEAAATLEVEQAEEAEEEKEAEEDEEEETEEAA